MCVSGSLISSRTWRSSSVSAPCISSSIFLPSSRERSRTSARQLLPGVADRLHARLHHAFLQFGGDVGQPLQRHLESESSWRRDDLEQLVARQHQLRHHRHQVFERVDVDTDRQGRDLSRSSGLYCLRGGATAGCTGGNGDLPSCGSAASSTERGDLVGWGSAAPSRRAVLEHVNQFGIVAVGLLRGRFSSPVENVLDAGRW